MNLKPIEELKDSECSAEMNARLGVGNDSSLSEIIKTLLKICRENHIGDELVKPLEPEWKRWRKWPDEKPIELSKVEFRSSDIGTHEGAYVPHSVFPFVSAAGGYSKLRVYEWRYLKPPQEWLSVEENGEPTEEGWYWVQHKERGLSCEYWFRTLWERIFSNWITHYCPVQTPPEFEEVE